MALAGYGGELFEAGLAHLEDANLIAEMSEITAGCEFCLGNYHLKTDILAQPFACRIGRVTVPDRLGFDIRSNLAKLEVFSRDRGQVI